MTINVSAVNDAPTASAPAAYAATEQVSLNLANTGLVVGDIDAGGAGVTVTLSVVSGTLTATPGATGVGIAGSGSTTLTLTGAVAQINNLLLGAGGSTLSYIINTDTPPASDTLTLSIDDGGNTGAGGALNASANSTITITAVNDAPVNAVPVSITVTEDVASALTGISIADVDALGGNMLVTFSVPSGTLAAVTGGGVAVGGSGSGTLTLTGTVANINAFIAASSVTFTTALNDTSAVTLTVTTDDQGNSPAPALNDVDTVTLNATAINEAPVNAVPAAQVVNEDAVLVFSSGNGNLVSIADLDAGASLRRRHAHRHQRHAHPRRRRRPLLPGGRERRRDDDRTRHRRRHQHRAGRHELFAHVELQRPGEPHHPDRRSRLHRRRRRAHRQRRGRHHRQRGQRRSGEHGAGLDHRHRGRASALTGISIADVDAGAGNVLVTFSVPSGTLAAVSGGGVVVGGSGSGTLSMTGTVGNINAFITASNITFTTALNETAAVTLTVTTDDQGNSPAPALNASDTVTLNVTA